MKTCKSCLWNKQCGSDCVCEYYDPLVSKKEDEKKYNDELRARSKEYKKLIKEQSK